MFKVKIFTSGKSKEPWLKEGLQEYHKRLTPFLTIEWILTKTDAQLEELLLKESNIICFDPQGIELTSEQFSQKMHQIAYSQGGKIAFAIGGADGFSKKVKTHAQALWSLSSLTFTHQIVRLILLEQIYRAVEINRGSKYHRS